jgi:hypothetical protein
MLQLRTFHEIMKLKLRCGVYREGSVFSTEIERNADVEALQAAIFYKKRYNHQYTFDASMLTLYLARKKEGKEGEWLKDDDTLDALLRGDVDKRFTKMRSSWKLTKEELLGPVFTPKEEEIHVLVELPDVEAAVFNKKPRLESPRREWRLTRWGSHVYNPESRSFLLEKEDMVESGLPPVRLMLYCRPTFHAQFKFMREEVLDEGHLGWILGPPGSGKSTTAVAFASTVNRSEWIVTWIHVSKTMKTWWCVRLIGDERKTRAISITDVEEVLQINDETKRHVVLVDGLIATEAYNELATTCIQWFIDDQSPKQRRRLAFVCSVSARANVDEDLEILTRARECPVWSWTLDEYHTAIEDDEVWRNVAPRLDAATVLPGEEMSRAAMVDAKYHYAGGSCRHMFDFDTVTRGTHHSAASAS